MSLSGENTTMMMPVAPAGFGGGFGGSNDDFLALLFLFGLMGGGGFGGFGGGGIGILGLLALLNGGGFGGFGCNGGSMNGGVGSEVQRGFDHSSVISKLDGITNGISDATYALNNGINNGFHVVDSAICNLGYQTQNGFNNLGAQLAQCCCDNQRAIDSVRYDMATQACDTRHAIQEGTRQILDAMNANYVRTLENENQSLKLAASQANQNAVLQAAMDANRAEIIRRTGNDCPVPAYWVNPPTPVAAPCGCGGY